LFFFFLSKEIEHINKFWFWLGSIHVLSLDIDINNNRIKDVYDNVIWMFD